MWRTWFAFLLLATSPLFYFYFYYYVLVVGPHGETIITHKNKQFKEFTTTTKGNITEETSDKSKKDIKEVLFSEQLWNLRQKVNLNKLDNYYCKGEKPEQDEFIPCKKVSEALQFMETMSLTKEKDSRTIQRGGHFVPSGCRPMHKVAIIVPYRDKTNTLLLFLLNMHNFLMKQQLEYRIFIIEQHGDDEFNRGRLFNAGFLEARSYGTWKCMVFHNVDLLPVNNRIAYACQVTPAKLCMTVVENKYSPMHSSKLLGGVFIMLPEHFTRTNGFPNSCWGSDDEDSEMYYRIGKVGLQVMKYFTNIGVYTQLPPENPEPLNRNDKDFIREPIDKDGLTTLDYRVVSVTLHRLYTHILVDIDPETSTTASPLTKLKNAT